MLFLRRNFVGAVATLVVVVIAALSSSSSAKIAAGEYQQVKRSRITRDYIQHRQRHATQELPSSFVTPPTNKQRRTAPESKKKSGEPSSTKSSKESTAPPPKSSKKSTAPPPKSKSLKSSKSSTANITDVDMMASRMDMEPTDALSAEQQEEQLEKQTKTADPNASTSAANSYYEKKAFPAFAVTVVGTITVPIVSSLLF